MPVYLYPSEQDLNQSHRINFDPKPHKKLRNVATDATVDKPEYRDGKIWINKTCYFDKAPEVSWGLYIGCYQPAHKWLEDRRGRALSFYDVKHYQRILKILAETDRIMQTVTLTLEAPECGA